MDPFKISDLPASPSGSDTLKAIPMEEHFDALAQAHLLTGVVSGCEVTDDPGTPDMTVDVAAGVVRLEGKPISVSQDLNNTIATAPSGNDRIDLVSVNSSGTVVVTTGTAETNPVCPDLPADSVPLAEVIVRDGVTAINQTDIQSISVPVPDNNGFYDVRWYGAVIDGTTDDSTEVQAAIDAANTAGGGVVYIPEGSCVIDTKLNVKSKVTLQGAGRRSTVLDCDNITTGNCIELGNLVQYAHIADLEIKAYGTSGNALHLDTSVAYCSFNRLRISGNDVASSKGLYLKGQNWLNSFKDIDIVDFVTGLHLANDASGAGIVVCTFENVYANSCTTGIDIDNTQRCTFQNCAADNCTDGFRMGISAFASATFIGCQTETNTNGYNVDGSGTWQFINCAAYTSAGSSWVVNSASAKCSWINCRDYNETTGSLTLTSIGDYFIIGCTWDDGTSPTDRFSMPLDMNTHDIIGLTFAGVSSTGARWDFQNGDLIGYDGDNAKRIEILNGGDVNVYDEDGVTIRWQWDESEGRSKFTGEVVANKSTRYTTAQTLTTADRFVLSDSAGSITHTLPALSGINEFPHHVAVFAVGAGNAVLDPGTDNINGTTGDVTISGGESPDPAGVVLVAWDTTDDWTILSRQGTVTQA